jgi:hypothetical protein
MKAAEYNPLLLFFARNNADKEYSIIINKTLVTVK